MKGGATARFRERRADLSSIPSETSESLLLSRVIAGKLESDSGVDGSDVEERNHRPSNDDDHWH